MSWTDVPQVEYSTNTGDYSEYPLLCEMDEVLRLVGLLQPCVYSLVFTLGVLGNGLVLATYAQHQRLLVTDIYLFNLAVADLLFLFTLPFQAAASQHGWVFGPVLCSLVHTVYKVNLYSGFLLLMCISIDRYFSIVWARAARRLRSRQLSLCRHICLAVWVSSLLLSIPHLLYSRVEQYSARHCLLSYTAGLNSWLRVATPAVQVLLGFLLPLLVMTFCYSVIVRTLLQVRGLEKHRTVRMVLLVVLVFVLCQTPYNIMLLLDTVRGNAGLECEQVKRRFLALQVTSSLAYTRCCLNPLVYAFVGVKFRRNLLRCLGRWRRRAGPNSLSSSRAFNLNTDISSTGTR